MKIHSTQLGPKELLTEINNDWKFKNTDYNTLPSYEDILL